MTSTTNQTMVMRAESYNTSPRIKQSHSTEITTFILLFSEVTSAIIFEKRNFGKKHEAARNNLIDMHLILSLKNEFCFDLPLFTKYIGYFYKHSIIFIQGVLKNAPVRCVIINPKNVTISSSIEQNTTCHLFDPLLKYTPFTLEIVLINTLSCKIGGF